MLVDACTLYSYISLTHIYTIVTRAVSQMHKAKYLLLLYKTILSTSLMSKFFTVNMVVFLWEVIILDLFSEQTCWLVTSNKRNKSLGVPVAASVTKSNKLSTFVIFLLWNFRICAVKKALIFKSDHFLILAVGLFHLYEVITNICMLPAPFMSLYFLWLFFCLCHYLVIYMSCLIDVIYLSFISLWFVSP